MVGTFLMAILSAYKSRTRVGYWADVNEIYIR